MLFVPTAVKTLHIFAHQHHKVCIAGSKVHIHQVDLDCDFHKFQLNTNTSFLNYTLSLFVKKEASLKIISQYGFISEFQRLQTTLRGPPFLA